MLQVPPLQLVHRVFGEFGADAACVQSSPDTFDFVLAACGMLADFYPDESKRWQLFNKRLEQCLSKPIYRVKLTSGVSETDGSIVDKLGMPEVTIPSCKIERMRTHHSAQCLASSAAAFAYVTCIQIVVVDTYKLTALTFVICCATSELLNLSSAVWRRCHSASNCVLLLWVEFMPTCQYCCTLSTRRTYQQALLPIHWQSCWHIATV